MRIPTSRWSRATLLIIALASGGAAHRAGGQVFVLDGVAANLGETGSMDEELSSRISIVLDTRHADSASIRIIAPLAGSGPLRARCWSDTILMVSYVEDEANILWLGRFVGPRVKGEYLTAATEYGPEQGGIWAIDLGPTESRALADWCSDGVSPPDISALRRATDKYRGAWNLSPSDPWHVDSLPSEDEIASWQRTLVPLREVMLEELQRRGLLPRLEQHVVAHGVTEAGSVAYGASMVQSGLLRLPPVEQYERFKALAHLILSMDHARCSRWAGLVPRYQPTYFLSLLDARSLKDHAAWQVQAFQAELSGSRPVLTQDKELQTEVLRRIASNLGPGVDEIFLEAIQEYDGLPASAKCWAERALVEGILAEASDDAPLMATTYFLWVTGRS